MQQPTEKPYRHDVGVNGLVVPTWQKRNVEQGVHVNKLGVSNSPYG